MALTDRYTPDMGMHFDYTPGAVVLPAGTISSGAYNPATPYVPGNIVSYLGFFWINIVASTGVAPPNAANWAPSLGFTTGATVAASYTVINDDHDVIDLMAISTGPFLVHIKNATVYLSNNPVHAYTVFGMTAGMPQRLLIPMRTRINDIIVFIMQDVSGVPNTVCITCRGVQLKPIR